MFSVYSAKQGCKQREQKSFCSTSGGFSPDNNPLGLEQADIGQGGGGSARVGGESVEEALEVMGGR